MRKISQPRKSRASLEQDRTDGIWTFLCTFWTVENEYASEKLVLFAVFVPKISAIGRNLTKFCQKISLHSFFETRCISIHQVPLPVHFTLFSNYWLKRLGREWVGDGMGVTLSLVAHESQQWGQGPRSCKDLRIQGQNLVGCVESTAIVSALRWLIFMLLTRVTGVIVCSSGLWMMPYGITHCYLLPDTSECAPP